MDRGIAVASLVAAALITAAVLLALRELRELDALFATFNRTTESLRQIERVRSAALEAETGQRGFVLTGERQYLEPYERGIRALGPEIDRLESALETPEQKQRVAALRDLADAKLAELKKTIALRDGQGLHAAVAVVKSDAGAHMMGRIRGILDELRGAEEATLSQRLAARHEATRRVQLATFCLAVLSLLTIGGVVWALVRARRRRDAAERMALESEQRLRVTLGSIGDAVIATDVGGSVVYLNAVAQALTGFRETDAIGLPLDQVFRIVNELTRETVENPFSKVMREGNVVGLANHTLLIARDGSERPIDDSGAPIRDAGGKIMGVVLVFRDVSARRSSEQARERLIRAEFEREGAEQANRAKDEFLAIVSHELRSPLAAAVTWVELLRAGSFDGEQNVRALAAINRNLHQQARLIDDLLDVSRIVAGKLAIDCLPVELVGVARAAVQDARDKADAKGLALRFEAPHDPAMAYADAGRLLQVLGNLLDNAIKFTPAGGNVELALMLRDGSLVIEVRDTGAGIAPGLLPRIFERFHQARNPLRRAQAGLGLGLAIARHLVELHGGKLEAASEGEGRGSTFRVTLPQMEASARKAVAAQPAPDAQSLTGIRVLLVEDHDDSREAIALALSLRGAEVTQAPSASRALEALEGELPTILISDIGMPEMNGLELIREVQRRAGERGARISAIALTGFASLEERQQALEAGYDKHLPKPVDLQRLTDELRALARARVV